MTSSSSYGEFSTSFSSTRETSSVWRNPCSFQPAVTLSQLKLICHHFHQLGNTNFFQFDNSHWILRFSDSSFSIARTIRSQLCLLLALLFLSWVLGSHPWLFFFHGSVGPVPGCPLSCPFGTCFIKPSICLLADSFSCYLVLGFASHATPICFSSWSAGCVLHRQLLMSGSSFTPILGFGSRVSLAFVCFLCLRFFWSSSSRSCYSRAALCATSRLVCLLCHCVVLDPRVSVLMGHSHCVVQRHCVKLDPPVSLTSLAE